jgi:hypothetical protein
VTEYIPGAYAREGAAGTRLVVTPVSDPELKKLATRYGRAHTSTSPLLLADAGSLLAPAALPDGATVRKVFSRVVSA